VYFEAFLTLKQTAMDRKKANDGFQTIGQALVWASRDIEAVDARILLQHVLNVNHAFILTHAEDALTTVQIEQFGNLVKQRIEGLPVAYLTGERAFYDLVFSVTPAVLVPRPETELLVDLSLETIGDDRPYHVLDLGTGSGAIAITIARHRPQANVVAIDLSSDAVSMAQHNALKIGTKNVRVIQGDWFERLGSNEKFDLIVSNPPYVAKNDPHLQQGDLRFEPPLALSTGDNGLSCIRHIIANAASFLIDGGRLLLEHGYNQSVECRQLMEAAGFRRIKAHRDLAGIERVCDGYYFV